MVISHFTVLPSLSPSAPEKKSSVTLSHDLLGVIYGKNVADIYGVRDIFSFS